MASSVTSAEAVLAAEQEAGGRLGQFLTGTEAREIAGHLVEGDRLTAALRVLAPGRRPQARALLEAAKRGALTWDAVTLMLRAITGAQSAPTSIDPLRTMPGHLAQHGRLTSSVPYLVDSARHSVVCSTSNFQRSSGLWTALEDAAQRPELTVRVCPWIVPLPIRHLAPARRARTRSRPTFGRPQCCERGGSTDAR